MSDLVLGIDVGTSAVRVAAIDQAGRVAHSPHRPCRCRFAMVRGSTQDPAVWLRGLDDAMARLASAVDLARIGALAVDGTSGTLVAVDELGRPVAAGSLYNDRPMTLLSRRSAGWRRRALPVPAQRRRSRGPCGLQRTPGVARIIHQADWIAAQFSGRFDIQRRKQRAEEPGMTRSPGMAGLDRAAASSVASCPRRSRAQPLEKSLPRPRAVSACRPRAIVVAGATDDARPFSRPAPTSREKPSPHWARRWC